MALGDIYQIKLNQRFGGTDMLNVFYYVSNDATIDANSLGQPFFNVIVLNLVPWVYQGVDYVGAEIENLFDPVDFGGYTFATQGQKAGNVLPNFVAMSYRMDRQRRDMRHGYKRFFGLIEEQVTGNGLNPSDASYQAILDMAGYLGDNLNTSSAGPVDADPVVVQRVPYTTSSGNQAYRLPQSQAEAVYFVVDGVTVQGPTTQNTRKL